MERPRILVVDDEQETLDVLKSILNSMGFEVDLAQDGEDALSRIRPGTDLVLLDVKMPGLDGFEVARRLRQNPATKDLPIIMVTALGSKTDRLNAVKAGANDFIQKPIDATELKVRSESLLKLKESQDEIKRQREELKKAYGVEKELLEKTLQGSVRVLVDILGLVSPSAFSQTGRIRRYMRQICLKLELPNSWQYELAAMLSQIGLVTLPSDVLEKHFSGGALSFDEERMLSSHASVAQNLLAKIPRLGLIPDMIGKQNESSGNLFYPGQLKDRSPATIGALLIKAIVQFDFLLSRGLSHRDAITDLRKSEDRHDPLILAALQDLHLDESGQPMDIEVRTVSMDRLVPGMTLAEDILSRGDRGILLGRKGQEVGPPLLQRLRNYVKKKEVREKIRVYVPRQAS